ncbi:MAG: DUF2029 domain-containing protein [Proteobacteria bacterium]|nr:DUF2029 domain-containing protein [Pseudomonadota bacterium]
MKHQSYLKQIVILSLITILFVVPYLFINGTNIVTHTYAFGSRQFWEGLSPYTDPRGAGDWFKYSPLFAWFYTPFAKLNSSLQAGCWGLFNIVCFWAGVSVWFPWKKLESKWLWLGFVLCSMEADGSFRYQQMNASLIGLSLLGLYFYKEGRLHQAGFWLTLVSNIKILPGLFLAGLLLPPKKKYIQGIVAGAFVCLIVPMIFWGFSKTVSFHEDWYLLLRRDTNTDGLLDVATVLKTLGFKDTKLWALYPLSVLSIFLFFVFWLKKKTFEWNLWIPLGLYTLLLVNPRTESPTFVLGGPGYLFLQRYALGLTGPLKYATFVFWSLGIFFTTLCMNDIWPKVIWNPSSWLQMNKTFGIFILWVLSVVLVTRQMISKKTT